MSAKLSNNEVMGMGDTIPLFSRAPVELPHLPNARFFPPGPWSLGGPLLTGVSAIAGRIGNVVDECMVREEGWRSESLPPGRFANRPYNGNTGEISQRQFMNRSRPIRIILPDSHTSALSPAVSLRVLKSARQTRACPPLGRSPGRRPRSGSLLTGPFSRRRPGRRWR